MNQPIAETFVRWTGMRAVLHNGWWLVTSLYLVLDAGLTPSELVLVGAAQGGIALLCEVPAGVFADTVSRKWSLVLSHILMAAAMIATGLVTELPAIVATQMLWGLSWTFASGADIAWVTDELGAPTAIPSVLTRAARFQLVGSATGMILLASLAWITHRNIAMFVSGGAMLLLGVHVAMRFRENCFVPSRHQRWSAAIAIFTRGVSQVRRGRALLFVFAATFLVNGASDAFARLYPKQLLDTGFPVTPDPVVWLTALGVAALLLGAASLRIVENRIAAVGVFRNGYVIAASVGALGLLLLALSVHAVGGTAAVLLVAGLAIPLTRTIGTIWVNRQVPDDVRATVHSMLAQAEYLGEIACGAVIGLFAQAASMPVTLMACAALFALTAALMSRAPSDERPEAQSLDSEQASASTAVQLPPNRMGTAFAPIGHATGSGDVDPLLEELLSRLKSVLGERVVGCYVYGSLATGDFDPDLSDIDLLAVTDGPLTEADLEVLRGEHEALECRRPKWKGRIEVAYLSREALQTFKSQESTIAKISPGEPLHFLEAGKKYLVNWFLVRERGIALIGPQPSQIIPIITNDEFIECIQEHVQEWQHWVHNTTRRGFQAYAVLTICRAMFAVRFRQQTSKVRAAAWAIREFSDWAGLIQQALIWRAQSAENKLDDPSTHPSVVRFVRFAADQVRTLPI